jgi:hypothetical protein
MTTSDPSAWERGARRTSRRGLAIGCLGLIVAGILAVLVLGQTRFGHGFGAALAIYDHGKPEVLRANYRETNFVATMDVYLAIGTDPARARSIGCELVRDELANAGIPEVRWAIYAANGELAATSDDGCP